MATNVENMISGRRVETPDVEARFQALVQSPLRAAILRFLSARPDEAFDLESLMQTFGRMRLDVENCIRELAALRAGASHQQPRAGSATRSRSPTATPSAICSIGSSSGGRPSATRIARRRSSASAK